MHKGYVFSKYVKYKQIILYIFILIQLYNKKKGNTN